MWISRKDFVRVYNISRRTVVNHCSDMEIMKCWDFDRKDEMETLTNSELESFGEMNRRIADRILLGVTTTP